MATSNIAKATKKVILSDLCNTIDIKRAEYEANNEILPYGFIAQQIAGVNVICPGLTRHDVNNELRRRKRKEVVCSVTTDITLTGEGNIVPAPVETVDPIDRNKGGRPTGSTKSKRRVCELALLAVKNEIATTYESERKLAGKKRLKRGRLDEIIEESKSRNGLPEDLTINKNLIRQRMKQTVVVNTPHSGLTSPLISIEPLIVGILIQMAQIRQCLTPSEAVQLINSLIKDTQLQQDLIKWKMKYSHGSDGYIGGGYWSLFKKRNAHLIRSKRGQKYELDRASWSTYANFRQMYEQVYDQMVEAGVAVKHDTPQWQNTNGDIVGEEDAVGCKVTHDLIHPEMCIVMDEVGGNTSQKGDGNNGGELHVCAKDMVPQQKASTKDKHFTLLGLTALNGDPVMCVVIFAGKRETKLYECGMDLFAEKVGDVSDDNFFENNSGHGKRFPGGPTCEFQGKTVPCFTRFSPKGSITSEILRDILATLDVIGVFDRSGGKRPFLLLDGHGSRLQIPFLEYINNPTHGWVACIGVPYGTALWQVGDSSEQNGAYMMALGVWKKETILKKEQRMMQLTIDPHEIILMINYAWAHSFARNLKNRKAIADRGWGPLNRALLLDATIRTSMTIQETEEEASYSILVPSRPPPSCTDIVPYSPTTADSTSTALTLYPSPVAAEILNFSEGTAACCLESIVRHSDLMEAREKIKVRRDEGKNLKEQLREGKKVTAGRAFKGGTCRLGQTIFDVVKENRDKRTQIDQAKIGKAREVFNKKVAAAATIKALGKPVTDLTVMQLKILLAPLKRKGDTAMPSKRADVLTRLAQWESRGALPVEEELDIVVREEEELILDEDDNESDFEGDFNRGFKNDNHSIVDQQPLQDANV